MRELTTDWDDRVDVDTCLPVGVVLAVSIPFICILVSTVLSPTFRWEAHALSHLGVTESGVGTATTVYLFNGGLIVGGLLGAVTATLLYRTRPRRRDRWIAVFLLILFLLLALVGVFPTGHPLHVPVAGAFFVWVTAVTWTDARIQWLVGNQQWAVAAFAAGLSNILVWVSWFTFAPDPGALAIPELLATLAFGAWLFGFAYRLSR